LLLYSIETPYNEPCENVAPWIMTDGIYRLWDWDWLFEAVLLQCCPRLHLRAKKVSYDFIRYLSEQTVEIVKEIWDLCPLADSTAAWIFIYLREASPMHLYRKSFEMGMSGWPYELDPEQIFKIMETTSETSR